MGLAVTTWELWANGTAAKIARLFTADSSWRLIDAYTPRVFGLFFHTFLISEFGAESYALPGWVLGTFGLFLAFVPDPHSYVLVRANGGRAQALYSLTVVSILLKVLLAGGLVCIGLVATPSGQVTAPHGESWQVIVLVALFYGGTEFLWAVLGTISLANGKIRKTAQTGIAARLTAVGMLFVAWKTGGVGIAENLLLATLPVFVGWCVLSPFSVRWKRIRFFFIHSLIRYSGWMQGIALITAGLLQMPTIVLAAWPGVDPALVGTIAFTNRLLLAGFQPFQILQSVVIRDAALAHSRGSSYYRTPLWIVFKLGGIGFATAAFIGLGLALWWGTIKLDALILASALSIGVAISIWYRHELAVVLATRSMRQILLVGYVPSIALTILSTPLLMHFLHVYGLALAVAGGWIALSNSWRWVK